MTMAGFTPIFLMIGIHKILKGILTKSVSPKNKQIIGMLNHCWRRKIGPNSINDDSASLSTASCILRRFTALFFKKDIYYFISDAKNLFNIALLLSSLNSSLRHNFFASSMLTRCKVINSPCPNSWLSNWVNSLTTK